jgi:hypothetical protein
MEIESCIIIGGGGGEGTSENFGDVDGGTPTSVYGGIDPIDGGGV